MGRKVFVGNLSYSITEADLRNALGSAGTVTYAKVVIDRDTGRSKGFGFVEFETDQQAANAMTQWNGQTLSGRQINVSEANERSGGAGRQDGNRKPSRAPRHIEVQVLQGSRNGTGSGRRRDGDDRGRHRYDD